MSLGIRGGLRYLLVERSRRMIARALVQQPSTRPYVLSAKDVATPLWCRPNTSDRQVFSQVFIEREYACLDGIHNPRLVIDCGANVGYTSAYFLSRFPGTHLIAVEPDRGNFAMLKRNLMPFGDRVTALRTAIWSHPASLKLVRGVDGDHRDWAVQVRQVRDDEVPDVIGTDIGSLLASSGYSRVDLLKIDVEHAEVEIFSGDVDSWLHRVDHIAIELHGEDARDTFYRVVDPAKFAFSFSGELTVATRAS